MEYIILKSLNFTKKNTFNKKKREKVKKNCISWGLEIYIVNKDYILDLERGKETQI